MTRKRRRLVIVLACGAALGSATALTLSALGGTMTFFLGPSELAARPPEPGRTFRLGGLVEAGSLERGTDDGRPSASFRLSDGRASVRVTFVGILPDLFREGQGVVALGKMAVDGTFRTDEVLAKHDATYMPKDVADALRKAGQWRPEDGPPPAAATWNTLVAAKKQGG